MKSKLSQLNAALRNARDKVVSFLKKPAVYTVLYLVLAIVVSAGMATASMGIGYTLGSDGSYRAAMEAEMARDERDGMYRAYMKTVAELQDLKTQMDRLSSDAYWTGWEHSCEQFGLKVDSDCYSMMESLRPQGNGQ